jgi:hypothetical protein
MALSPRQVAYITANPLRSTLHDARALLLDAGQMPPPPAAITGLVSILIVSKALAHFPMLGGPGRLVKGLRWVLDMVRDHYISASVFHPLSHLVHDNESECRI